MIALALAVVGLAAVVATWDVWRRALAAQVQSAALRVEALRREDHAALEARVRTLEGEVDSINRAGALRGARR